VRIDNFALSMHEMCPVKYHLRIRQHYTSRDKSPALGFGGALHYGLAEWYRSSDLVASLQAIKEGWHHSPPVDDYRTLDKCLAVMQEYTHEYPREPWNVLGADAGTPIVEKAFTLATGLYLPCGLSADAEGVIQSNRCSIFDMPKLEQTACGMCGRDLEPIEYGGIIDVVAGWNDVIYVVDHKSTSRLGDQYFLQFKPDNQMTGYAWAARELSGQRVAGAIINAIGVYKTQATKFKRELTTRSGDDFTQWLSNVQAGCMEIRLHDRLDVWPWRTSACTLYGRCDYHKVHSALDPSTQQKVLEQYYVKDRWDYEDRD